MAKAGTIQVFGHNRKLTINEADLPRFVAQGYKTRAQIDDESAKAKKDIDDELAKAKKDLDNKPEPDQAKATTGAAGVGTPKKT